MIVWDVALCRNIGTNHGKSMVWPCIHRRMAYLGRFLQRLDSAPDHTSHRDRSASMGVEVGPPDG